MPIRWVAKSENDFYGLDAYTDWVMGPGREFTPRYREYDLLIRLRSGQSIDDIKTFVANVRLENLTSGEPDFKFEMFEGLEALGFAKSEVSHVTARVDQRFLDIFNSAIQASYDIVEKIFADVVLGQELPADAVCPKEIGPELTPETSELAERAVITAVIDEGLAFGHERFRTADGKSRVEYAWLQDAACAYRTDGVPFGRELTKRGFSGSPAGAPGIDRLLHCHMQGGPLDEAAFYREAGLIDFGRAGHKAAAQRVAHGTHVMDLACGFAPEENRIDRPIICVQLPTATVADTSGIGLQKFMLDALFYIFERANRLAGARTGVPLVINFSSGVLAGSHDGSSPIETALDRMIRARSFKGSKTAIVLPAGNSHLARSHAQFDLEPGASHTLDWMLPPDDQTFSFLEVWLPAEADGANVELRIQPPGEYVAGRPLSSRCHRHAVQWEADGGRVLCKAYYENKHLQSIPAPAGSPGSPALPAPLEFNRGRFMVALLPTAYHDVAGPLAPAGRWMIMLTNAGSTRIEGIHAWIQWDDRPISYPRVGRQSYFDDSDYRRFQVPSGQDQELDIDPADQQAGGRPAGYVRRATTLNGIATGQFVVTVGGHRRKDQMPAKYSSIGPALAAPGQPQRAGPDATAVTDESIVHRGILAAGSRDGTCVVMNGTSVAAPQVARFIANAFTPPVTGPEPSPRRPSGSGCGPDAGPKLDAGQPGGDPLPGQQSKAGDEAEERQDTSPGDGSVDDQVGAGAAQHAEDPARARAIVECRAREDEPVNSPNPGIGRIGFGRLNLHPHIDTPAQRHRQPEPDLPGG